MSLLDGAAHDHVFLSGAKTQSIVLWKVAGAFITYSPSGVLKRSFPLISWLDADIVISVSDI
jgi:hypothetical protein